MIQNLTPCWSSDCSYTFFWVKKNITFILFPLMTISFQNHLQTYQISINKGAQWLLIHWDNLANKFSYNIHMMGDGKNYIVPLQ